MTDTDTCDPRRILALAHAEDCTKPIAGCQVCSWLYGLEPVAICSEGPHINDDNPGAPMCRTCQDWGVST